MSFEFEEPEAQRCFDRLYECLQNDAPPHQWLEIEEDASEEEALKAYFRMVQYFTSSTFSHERYHIRRVYHAFVGKEESE